MDKIIIPDVEIAVGPIPDKPFSTQKRIVQLDEVGLLFESKKFKWTSLKEVNVDFFLGNPYIQCNFDGNGIISFWFPSKWYKLRKKPWFTTSEQLTIDFIEKISEITNQGTLKSKVLNEINESDSPAFFGQFYHWTMNLVFLLLPVFAVYLLVSFVLWVLANPGGVFEL